MRKQQIVLTEQEAKDLRSMLRHVNGLNARNRTKDGDVAVGQSVIGYYQETAQRLLPTIEIQLGA